ncbi:GntR family transcriptional regulator [Bradyrhizobium sp. Ai1a-2]|uniref:GntR family transcriptional regulator n=1 Tax=Bradyrhizobium sp. Ai1a-2 TaxID=196490 RepID=UPI0004018734|nr:GntR family transcriptional regulator [Bradyrhizobium sp. Ai1a-2]
MTISAQTANDQQIAWVPGTSLHRQLFVILRDQILRGVYSPGQSIPNEEALCARFGVSRITVRRAVADLETSGLLVKRHGRGTFVSDKLPPARPSATLGLLDALRKSARETQAEVLNVETAEPPLDIARQLDLVAGVPAVHAVRLRRRGKTPVMVTEAWVPEAVGRNVTLRELQTRALYEILVAQGIRFGRVAQEITAVSASPFYAKQLDTELAAPLVRITRLLYDTDRHPVQHLTIHISPERSRLLMDISIESVNTLAAGSIYHEVGPEFSR